MIENESKSYFRRLDEDLKKCILGKGTPNMYNPDDWPYIFALYLRYVITNPLDLDNTYPTFIIRNDGTLLGLDTNPLPPGNRNFSGFTPTNNGHSSTSVPTPVPDGSIYGNRDGVNGNDGFYVPFYAFVRFAIGYWQTPSSSKLTYLSNGSYYMAQLRFTSGTIPYTFYDTYMWLVTHKSTVLILFKSRFPPPRNPVRPVIGPSPRPIITEIPIEEIESYLADESALDYYFDEYLSDPETQNIYDENLEEDIAFENGNSSSLDYWTHQSDEEGGDGYYYHWQIDDGGNPVLIEKQDFPPPNYYQGSI